MRRLPTSRSERVCGSGVLCERRQRSTCDLARVGTRQLPVSWARELPRCVRRPYGPLGSVWRPGLCARGDCEVGQLLGEWEYGVLASVASGTRPTLSAIPDGQHRFGSGTGGGTCTWMADVPGA